jgi:hypothetical protein
MGREINQLLGRIFAQRRKDGRTDLEAIETAVRSTVHQAGAAALTELLQFPAPPLVIRTLRSGFGTEPLSSCWPVWDFERVTSCSYDWATSAGRKAG